MADIISKFKLVRLDENIDVIRGITYDKNDQVSDETNNVILTADNITLDGRFNVVKKIFLNDKISLETKKRLSAKDVFICFSSGSKKHVGKLTYIGKDTQYYAGGFMGILRAKAVPKDELLPQYLYEILSFPDVKNRITGLSTGANIQNLSSEIGKLKIPLPPLDVQRKIVVDCNTVDEENNQIRMNIENYRAKIEQLFREMEMINTKGQKLSDARLFSVFIGRRIIETQLVSSGQVPVYSANVNEPFGYINERLLTDFSMPSVLWGIDGEWMVNYIPAEVEFYPTDHCGVLRVLTEEVHPRYLAWALDQAGKQKGFSRTLRASTNRIMQLTMQLPPIAEQNRIVEQVFKYEKSIATEQEKLSELNGRKQDILRRYLYP